MAANTLLNGATTNKDDAFFRAMNTFSLKLFRRVVAEEAKCPSYETTAVSPIGVAAVLASLLPLYSQCGAALRKFFCFLRMEQPEEPDAFVDRLFEVLSSVLGAAGEEPSPLKLVYGLLSQESFSKDSSFWVQLLDELEGLRTRSYDELARCAAATGECCLKATERVVQQASCSWNSGAHLLLASAGTFTFVLDGRFAHRKRGVFNYGRRPDDFKKHVKMFCSLESTFEYSVSSEAQTVCLRHGRDPRFRALVLLPHPHPYSSTKSALEELIEDGLEQRIAELQEERGSVVLPRWKSESYVSDLSSRLCKKDPGSVFSDALRGREAGQELFVEKAGQVVWVKTCVAEDSPVAPSTVGGVSSGCAGEEGTLEGENSEPFSFVADRPFLFLVYVADPCPCVVLCENVTWV